MQSVLQQSLFDVFLEPLMYRRKREAVPISKLEFEIGTNVMEGTISLHPTSVSCSQNSDSGGARIHIYALIQFTVRALGQHHER